ncbi:hypothetical protein F4859DRAFT_434102 [Xylaria cf. heliscus]|nr:hypothetical protein F4859DRAFT_434102 [Xylaria cf. heliscus]
MCYQRYKGYTRCGHADPQGTPIELEACDEFFATGRCEQERQYILMASSSLSGPCPTCWLLECDLMEAIGSLEDGDGGSAAWRLWYRLGWLHNEAELVEDLLYVRRMLYHEMVQWQGPYHNYQGLILHWIVIFNEFKYWLRERLEKRDAWGRLYFPPGEERGVRIEKKKVLQHLVRWMLVNMAEGSFNGLEIAVFREGLDMAFNNLIYQWDTHFLEEPGCDNAMAEFTTYWTYWYTMREAAPTQGGTRV